MSISHDSEASYTGPTTRERMEALAEHSIIFEHNAKLPQTVIHQRFGEAWSMALAYVEGKVHRCVDTANVFFWMPRDVPDEGFEAEFSNVMEDLVDVLLLHCA
jgi:hypothetical protein